MSKWNRDGSFAIGLVVGGFFAVFCLVWVVGLNYCPNSPCKNENANRNYVYDVPLGIGPDTTFAFNEADEEWHPNYYERQDLRAQEVMSRATNAIALLTFISVLMGFIGMASLIYTMILQRKNNEISDSIRTHQLRPYLVFTNTIITRNQIGGWCAAMTLRNVGQTIASDVIRHSGQYVGFVIADDEMVQKFPAREKMSDLGPQQENTYRFDITDEMIEKINSSNDGPIQLRYGGFIQYADSFGGNHKTGFAFRTIPGQPIGKSDMLLALAENGNYST